VLELEKECVTLPPQNIGYADQRRIPVYRGQMAATNDELDELIVSPGYEYGEPVEERYSRCVIHEARMYNMRNNLQHKQKRVNRLETIVQELET
jgi:hypothetical protein